MSSASCPSASVPLAWPTDVSKALYGAGSGHFSASEGNVGNREGGSSREKMAC